MKESCGAGGGCFRTLPVSNAWVEWRLNDAAWVVKARERLQSVSWFMKN